MQTIKFVKDATKDRIRRKSRKSTNLRSSDSAVLKKSKLAKRDNLTIESKVTNSKRQYISETTANTSANIATTHENMVGEAEEKCVGAEKVVNDNKIKLGMQEQYKETKETDVAEQFDGSDIIIKCALCNVQFQTTDDVVNCVSGHVFHADCFAEQVREALLNSDQ